MLADLDSAVRGWGDTFTNTLVDGLLTGKMAWQDFANQIIRDLATMAVRAAITRPLLMSMGFGFADGGIMTSEGGGTAYQVRTRGRGANSTDGGIRRGVNARGFCAAPRWPVNSSEPARRARWREQCGYGQRQHCR